MNGISAELEGLADVEELGVKNSPNARLVLGIMEHDMSTIKIFRRSLRISLVFDISCQQTNFCAHVNEVAICAYSNCLCEVLELKRGVQG